MVYFLFGQKSGIHFNLYTVVSEIDIEYINGLANDLDRGINNLYQIKKLRPSKFFDYIFNVNIISSSYYNWWQDCMAEEHKCVWRKGMVK